MAQLHIVRMTAITCYGRPSTVNCSNSGTRARENESTADARSAPEVSEEQLVAHDDRSAAWRTQVECGEQPHLDVGFEVETKSRRLKRQSTKRQQKHKTLLTIKLRLLRGQK